MKLKVGQIWEYAGQNGAPKRTILDRNDILLLTGPLTAIEIMALDRPKSHGSGLYHPCSILRDDTKLFTTALLDDDGHLILLPEIFEEAIKKGEWTLLMGVAEAPKSGATCIKCKQDYPYANYAPDFKCYGCRVGF